MKKRFRNIVLRVAIVLTVFPFSTCSRDSNAIRATPEPLIRPTPARTAFEKGVYPILKVNCSPCHITRSPQIAANNLDVAYSSTKEQVNFTAVEQSLLVAKSKDGHCGERCRLDTGPLVRELRNWAELER